MKNVSLLTLSLQKKASDSTCVKAARRRRCGSEQFSRCHLREEIVATKEGGKERDIISIKEERLKWRL